MPGTLLIRLFAVALVACLLGTAWASTPAAGEATPAPDSLATFVGYLADEILQNPSDLAVGPDGSIWVTDLGTDQLHKFDADGEHILTFGETGEGSGQFEFADFGAVDLDGEGNVYVLDTGYQRVQKFTPDLEFELQWGGNGQDPGEFQHPSDIAVRDDGTSFVVDALSGRVQEFDSSGGFVREIAPTNIATEFFEPARLGLDAAGNLYVPDITRVYVFDRDGRHIRTIQTNETDNGSIGLGMGAAVSDSGFLYVSDLQNGRVAVLDPDGQFVGSWGAPGSGEGQFVEIDSLAIDSTGRLLVLDYGNRRIQVFELSKPHVATPVTTPGSVIRDTFSIGDRSLYLECMGTGSPTVIIEHGQAGAATDMWPLQRELAEDTRVCIYDRAGKGRSDPVPFPRTAAEAVADIHSLLEVAAIPSPYVLIGQSAGGTIVQLFARTYPSEVVGVVAMNAVPPAGPWLEKALPLMTEQERAEEEAFYRGASEGDAFDEAFDWYASFAQLEAAPAPPDVPFLVLISTIAECDRPDDVCGRTHGVYETTMQALAASWPLGRFTQLDTGHEIFYSPDAVSAIRQVIEAARDPSAWAAAAAATPAA